MFSILQWTISELACYTYSLVTVPLYDTLGAEAISFIIDKGAFALSVMSSVCVCVCVARCRRGGQWLLSICYTFSSRYQHGDLRHARKSQYDSRLFRRERASGEDDRGDGAVWRRAGGPRTNVRSRRCEPEGVWGLHIWLLYCLFAPNKFTVSFGYVFELEIFFFSPSHISFKDFRLLF